MFKNKNYIKIIMIFLFIVFVGFIMLQEKSNLVDNIITKKGVSYLNNSHINMEVKNIDKLLSKVIKETQNYNSVTLMYLKNRNFPKIIDSKIEELEKQSKEKKLKLQKSIINSIKTKKAILKQEIIILKAELISKVINFLIFTTLFVLFYFLIKRSNINLFNNEEKIEGIEESDKQEYTKVKFKRIVIAVYVVFSIIFFIFDNLAYLMTTLSIISILLALGIRDMLSDMLVGILLRFRMLSFAQNVIIKMELKDNIESSFKIKKIGLFKIILFQIDTSEIHSIKNTNLILKNFKIQPMDKLQNIDMCFKIPFNENIEELEEQIKKEIMDEIKNNQKDYFKFNAKEFREAFPLVKSEYSFIPKIKPKVLFYYKNESVGVITMKISFNTYSLISLSETTSIFFKKIQNVISIRNKEFNCINEKINSF